MEKPCMGPSDFLSFSIDREIRSLFKRHLENFEDILERHDANFRKLFDGLPKEYQLLVIQANYLDEAASQHFRKRALDAGNTALRNCQSEINKFDISFKTTKS